MWQHVKLSDVSLGTHIQYSLVADEDVKKPNKTNWVAIDLDKSRERVALGIATQCARTK